MLNSVSMRPLIRTTTIRPLIRTTTIRPLIGTATIRRSNTMNPARPPPPIRRNSSMSKAPAVHNHALAYLGHRSSLDSGGPAHNNNRAMVDYAFSKIINNGLIRRRLSLQ